MSIGNKGPFPEKPHSNHKPSGEEPHFVKKSEHVGRGHEDNKGRMEHPFGKQPPNDPSCEGTDNNMNGEGSGLFPEQS